MKDLKIAIVHDALVVKGGAEKLTMALSQTFPEAPIYTSVYLPEKTFPYFKTKKIITLPGGGWVHNERQFKRRFLQWFFGFRFLDLSQFDVILSSSTYAAKYVKAKKGSIHISYLHSPFRFLWKRDSYSPESLPFKKLTLWLIDRLIPLLRKIDNHYTNQISRIVTNSKNMADLIKESYDRNADIIYPPIDVYSYTSSLQKKEYYLVVSRLLSYKRIDLAIYACNKTSRKLVVIGEGPEKETLMKIAGPGISFLGSVAEDELKKHYSEARGLIFPGVEDFGIVPVEAQASGCPVIAFKAGGALETIKPGDTGVFFEHQSVDSLLDALDKFERSTFDSITIRENAQRFDISIFQKKITKLVNLYKK